MQDLPHVYPPVTGDLHLSPFPGQGVIVACLRRNKKRYGTCLLRLVPSSLLTSGRRGGAEGLGSSRLMDITGSQPPAEDGKLGQDIACVHHGGTV